MPLFPSHQLTAWKGLCSQTCSSFPCSNHCWLTVLGQMSLDVLQPWILYSGVIFSHFFFFFFVSCKVPLMDALSEEKSWLLLCLITVDVRKDTSDCFQQCFSEKTTPSGIPINQQFLLQVSFQNNWPWQLLFIPVCFWDMNANGRFRVT